MKRQISRRSFLRSSATGISTVVGLPLLEAMYDSSSAFANVASENTRVFAFYLSNGIIEENWYPERRGKTNFDLTSCSLKAFDDLGLKNDISLYRGMNNTCINQPGNDHMIAISSWLTGVPLPNDRVQTHTPSLDQQFADAMQAEYGRTKVHSLQWAANSFLDRPNNDNYFNPLKNALTWGSDNRLRTLRSALKDEFDRLYDGANTGGGLDRRTQIKINILDDIKDDRQALMNQLGASDKARLEAYFTSLSDIEESLKAALENAGSESECSSTVSNIPNHPNGRENGNIEVGDHARIAAKILAQAFACGLTRAATYTPQGEASNLHYPELGIDRHFHNTISHNRNGLKHLHTEIDVYRAELCANFMKELKDTQHGPEGSTLLDGTAVLFGSGLGNADNHTHNDIALLVGGHFGNWEHGNYHELQNRDHADLIDTVRAELGLQDLGKNRVPIS